MTDWHLASSMSRETALPALDSCSDTGAHGRSTVSPNMYVLVPMLTSSGQLDHGAEPPTGSVVPACGSLHTKEMAPFTFTSQHSLGWTLPEKALAPFVAWLWNSVFLVLKTVTSWETRNGAGRLEGQRRVQLWGREEAVGKHFKCLRLCVPGGHLRVTSL